MGCHSQSQVSEEALIGKAPPCCPAARRNCHYLGRSSFKNIFPLPKRGKTDVCAPDYSSGNFKSPDLTVFIVHLPPTPPPLPTLPPPPMFWSTQPHKSSSAICWAPGLTSLRTPATWISAAIVTSSFLYLSPNLL